MTLGLSDLRPAQPPAIDFVYRGDQTMLLADVGTGKTVIAYTAMQQWIEDGSVMTRALVVAPRRVVLETWLTEIDEWEHLDRDTLRIGCLTGESGMRRKALIDGPMHQPPKILLINYELLPWLMATYPDGLPGFNTIVFDEIDKLKDHKTNRFKGVKRHRHKDTGEMIATVPGMKEWKDNFEIRIGMTGTPAPNHLLDLWAQMYIIDDGLRLGDNYYDFRTAHFYQSDYAGYKHEILPGREQWIYERISSVVHRIKSLPGIDTPEVIELPVRWLDMSTKDRAEYRALERNYIVELKRKRKVGDVITLPDSPTSPVGAAALREIEEQHQVEADGAAAAYGKLKQLAQGFAYIENPDDPDDRAYPMLLSHRKLIELESLISELQGQQLVIVYHFQAQLKALQKRFGKRLRWLSGGMTDADAKQTIADWNAGLIENLAVQPQAAGHGLNLQKGGAHHVAIITIPESGGLYHQVIGRVARGGNPAGIVYVHRILTRDTVDEERDAVVHGKIDTEEQLLEAMEARQ